MNIEKRIQELQKERHALLAERETPKAAVSTIDIKLNTVRTELLELYKQIKRAK